jgi:hypothetical protein
VVAVVAGMEVDVGSGSDAAPSQIVVPQPQPVVAIRARTTAGMRLMGPRMAREVTDPSPSGTDG